MADARELTKQMENTRERLFLAEKEIEYLKQEFEKQRLIISDMQIDVKMLQNMQSRRQQDREKSAE